MRDEQEPVALSVNDDLLAAELHDAVWMGDDDLEAFSPGDGNKPTPAFQPDPPPHNGVS